MILPVMLCTYVRSIYPLFIRKGNEISARLKAVYMERFKRFVISRCFHRIPHSKRFYTTIILMLTAFKVNKKQSVRLTAGQISDIIEKKRKERLWISLTLPLSAADPQDTARR